MSRIKKQSKAQLELWPININLGDETEEQSGPELTLTPHSDSDAIITFG